MLLCNQIDLLGVGRAVTDPSLIFSDSVRSFTFTVNRGLLVQYAVSVGAPNFSPWVRLFFASLYVQSLASSAGRAAEVLLIG